MTLINTLRCLLSHVKEVRKRDTIYITILKRYCKKSCTNPNLCDEILATCNVSSFTPKDFKWQRDR